MTSIHPAKSVEDALTMLDTRLPLLTSERRMLIQGLWDTAFRAGAEQGRLAGTEAEKRRLAKIARELRLSEEPQARGTGDALLRIADIEAFEETVDILRDPDTLAAIAEGNREYQDPGLAVRDRLFRQSRAIRQQKEEELRRQEAPAGEGDAA